MAKVQIPLGAARNEGLPPVCMCCGAPAAVYKRQQFIWTPKWAIIIGVLGTWFFWRAKIDGPLCQAHRHHWTWRWVLPLCLLVLGLGICAGSYIYLDITRGKVAAAPLHRWIYIAAAIAFVLWSILLQILRHTGVYPIYIDDRSITFTGVADAFAEAVRHPIPEVVPEAIPVADRGVIPEVLPADDVLEIPLPKKPPPRRQPPR